MSSTRNILVFNCGSSSLKYRIIRMPGELDLAAGEAQRVGPKTALPAQVVHQTAAGVETRRVEMVDHKAAFIEVMRMIGGNPDLAPDAIGHRLVHGGKLFDRSTLVTEGTLKDLDAVAHLAPIHNPPATALVRACLELYPRLPQVLIFDTAYHATIPAYASTYALPSWMRDDLGIRKYGFHGTSHGYVVAEAASFLGVPLEELNAVSCHLGSGGASLCAVVGGHSVDNTMGYSPLQGLLMSTRSGDLDAGVVMRLLERSGRDADSVERLLNRESGVLGLSGLSADIRDILARAVGEPDGRVKRTVEVYLTRLRKYLGSYLTVVGNPHAIIFTDTIGETVPQVRARICEGLEDFGIAMDGRKNESPESLPCDIAAEGSRVRLLVIRTNEELAIARQTFELLEYQTVGG